MIGQHHDPIALTSKKESLVHIMLEGSQKQFECFVGLFVLFSGTKPGFSNLYSIPIPKVPLSWENLEQSGFHRTEEMHMCGNLH
jgi:hypothetical protein